jgi:hypothetical protein
MRTLFRFSIRFTLILFLANIVVAQETKPLSDPGNALTITAFATGDHVRFAAPSSVVQIRLEIYDSAGKKLFDNEVRGGNVLDWHLQDGQAEPLADDTYLCVTTVKSLSGKITQRIGSVTIEKATASVQPVDVSQMTAQQSQAIGPVEDNASLTVLKEDDNRTTTVIAHNGEEGQITRGRGALSFRIGDFHSGKDTERMRLTPEGNLGIGITHPLVRLDVDGLVRASQGIVFPDGSIQYSAATKTYGVKSSLPDPSFQSLQSKSGKNASGRQEHIDVLGTGTQNHIAKWTETGGSGTLGDTGIFETLGGNVGIGTINPQAALHVIGNQFTKPLGATPTYEVFAGSDPTSTVMLTTDGAAFGWQIAPTNAATDTIVQVLGQSFASVPNRGEFGIYLGADSNSAFKVIQRGGPELMRVNRAGNVGIGTPNPAQLLHVNSGSGNAAALVQTPAGFFAQYQLNSGATNPWIIGTQDDFASNALLFRNGSTDLMAIKPDGSVGIGTTDPAGAKLYVASDDRFTAVQGFSNGTNGIGGFFAANIGTAPYGVLARSQPENPCSQCRAGYFSASVEVVGTVHKTASTFKIDHPLDPAHKYLSHSVVESPEYLNLYNGTALLDQSGEAVVQLPEWFEALNKDFRYQLTAIGAPGPNLYIAEKVAHNRFKIAGGQAGMEVSWQVTGVRQDAYVKANPLKVEEEKPAAERGYYLHPEVHGQPEEKGIEWARRPELMRQMKERREQAQPPKP